MAKRVQRRRGTTAEHSGFTGAEGEITVDTTIDTLVVHDGSTPGGHPLGKADGSNLDLTNQIGIIQLNVADGQAGWFLQTNGAGTLSFAPVDVGGTALGGSKLGGTINAATIDEDAVGVYEINVDEGQPNQFLKTDGVGGLSFATVVTDPSMAGDVGGTTSANVIGAGKVLASHLSTPLKLFTVDPHTGSLGVDTFSLSAAPGSVNSVIAYIDGIVQPPSAYSISESPNQIIFTSDPPVGSVIRIVHLGFQSTVGVPSDGTISNAKLAANAVTTDKILDGTIATADIAANAITENQILAQTVTNASIFPGTIRSQEIENGSIGSIDIADNAISGDKIALAGNLQGDIMYYDGSNWVVLPAGISGYHLQTSGVGANPSWTAQFTTGTQLVADGALPNGAPVILKANGKVSVIEAVSETPSSKYTLGNNITRDFSYIAMDPNNADKFVVAWHDLTTHTGKACVGTIDRTAAALDLAKTVTVAASKFVMDGVSQGALSWHEGKTYTFDVSDPSNATHVLAFSTTSDGTHNSGTEYTTRIIRSGDPGTANATVTIVAPGVTSGATLTTLYYYCTQHASMGGTITNIPMFTFGTTSVFYSGWFFETHGSAEYVPSSNANFTGKGVIAGESSTGGNSAFKGSIIQFQVANNGAGTTLTFSAKVDYASVRAGRNIISMDPHNAGKGVVAHQDNANSFYGTFYQFTVTGGTGIVGWGTTSSHVFFTQPTPTIDSFQYDPQVAGRGIITYGTYGSPAIKVMTVNGTGDAVSSGAEQNVPTSHLMSGGSLVAAWDPNTSNTNKIMFISDDAHQSIYNILGTMATVSGTNLTFGAEYELQNSLAARGNPAFFHPSNNGVFTLPSHAYSDGFGIMSTGSISGDVITFNGDFEYYQAQPHEKEAAARYIFYDRTYPTNYIFQQVDSVDGDKGKVMYGPNGSNFHSMSTLTSENWLGFSNGAYADGATAIIDIVGSNGDQSGLTIAEQYYVQTDGTLSTTADTPNVPAGKALTATQIFIRG